MKKKGFIAIQLIFLFIISGIIIQNFTKIIRAINNKEQLINIKYNRIILEEIKNEIITKANAKQLNPQTINPMIETIIKEVIDNNQHKKYNIIILLNIQQNYLYIKMHYSEKCTGIILVNNFLQQIYPIHNIPEEIKKEIIKEQNNTNNIVYIKNEDIIMQNTNITQLKTIQNVKPNHNLINTLNKKNNNEDH